MKGCKFDIGMMVLLAGVLLVGCSHDADLTLRSEIAVQTGVTHMVKRIHSISDNTELQAQDIKIDAYYHGTNTAYLSGAKLHYDTEHTPSAAWVFWDGSAQVHYYWPFDGSKTSTGVVASTLDFVGSCPFAAPDYITSSSFDHASGASYTFDMSSYMTVASQEDMQEYLIAVLDSQTLNTQTEAGGALPMNFKHPLAQVKFTITAASGTHVTINSIGIADVYTGGTCTYDGTEMSWGGYSGNDTVKIEDLALKYGTASTETDPVYILPYEGTKYLIVNATWDEWQNVTISDYGTDVAFNWESGHSYVYNLTLDKSGLKVDVTRFTEQW